jgi:outer membrane protein assembly factor BamD
VVRKYPTSEYATSAKAKLKARATSSPARKWMSAALAWARDYTAAINCFKMCGPPSDHPPCRGSAGAATEAYMAIGIVGEAQRRCRPGHNFPDSRWYKDAIILKSGVSSRARIRFLHLRAFKKMGLG